MSAAGGTTADAVEVTKRKVTIEIEDFDGGFHLSLRVDPPLPEDGSQARPTAALMAGAVARRAIQEMVNQGHGNEAN